MATPKTFQLMIDGELHEALVRVDGNSEWACYTKAGRTFFFPQTGVDEEGKEIEYKLADHVKKHNSANSVKPILAEDAAPEVDEELEAWLNGDTVEAEETIAPDGE